MLAREAGAAHDLVAAGLGAGLAQAVAVRVADARELAQRAVGQHHRVGEVGDELLHRLAHPPRRVRPERRAAPGVEALERAQEADDALLQQLHPLDAGRVAVHARQRRDHRQEGLDELGARARVARLRGGDERSLGVRVEHRAAAERFEVAGADDRLGGAGAPQGRGQLEIGRARPLRGLGERPAGAARQRRRLARFATVVNGWIGHA